MIKLLLLLSLACAANASLQEEMIHDLTVAKYNFANKYAPKEWKKKHCGWTLDASFEKAKNRILLENPQTITGYQQIFKEFLLSMQDFHVTVDFYSTSTLWFPISLKKIGNHYYISSLSGVKPLQFYSFNAEPLNITEEFMVGLTQIVIGDEIVAIDGVPIHHAIEKILADEHGGNHSPSAYSVAAKKLFYRLGQSQSTFSLTLPDNVTYTLPWFQIKERIKEQPIGSQKLAPVERKAAKKSIEHLLPTDFCVRSFIPLFENPSEDDDNRLKGELPPLGPIVWETNMDQLLYAYLYTNAEGKKIGYIYLKQFSNLLIDEMIDVISFLQAESEGLVLDITTNPGGSVLFAFALLSLLSDHPLACPKQVETLIQQDLYAYALLYDELDLILQEDQEEHLISSLTFSRKMMFECMQYLEEVFKIWESGKRITPPLHLLGISEISPHPQVQYTKPILTLINELDFSCADIVPAILQDNQRAVLFGKRTGGAGGYVKTYQSTNRFGIGYYTITGSLVYRTNGKVIENLGVDPDIPYEITHRDLLYNYAPYIRRVNTEINTLIKQKNSAPFL